MASPPHVTPREWHVLELSAEGLSSRQIAERLGVTEQTITYHLGNLVLKFGATNRAGLVARAFVFGYLDAAAWPPRQATTSRIA